MVSLDESFGEHWHVLVGGKNGFACKKRNNTMGVWKIDEGKSAFTVVIWQSPGIEEVQATANVDDAPCADVSEDSDLTKGKSTQVTIRVLEPGGVEDGTETAAVVELLRSDLAKRNIDNTDMQELARAIRTSLT